MYKGSFITRFLLTLILICTLTVIGKSIPGCATVIVSSVNPDYPNCVEHNTTTCCEGHCSVVITHDCY